MTLGLIYAPRNPEFGEAIIKLLGHVLGGAALFLGLAAASWGLGWAVEALHRIHPFNPTVFTILHWVEVAILYLDIGLSGIVLVVGAVRFIREMANW